MLTPEQITQLRGEAGLSPTPPSPNGVNLLEKRKALWGLNAPVVEKPPMLETISEKISPVVEPLKNFATGVAKGEVETVKGLGTIGQKIIDKTFKTEQAGGAGDIFRPGTEKEQKLSQAIDPEGLAENLGYGTEKFAEFLAPAKTAVKGERAVDLISKGIASPLGAALTRIGGKALVQGATTGGVKFVQTGGDTKAALETGALAAGTRGAFATIGEGARALKIPERLYSTIFKNSSKDMLQELRANGVVALQKNNPEKFKEFVEKGIIQVDKSGAPRLNETLAEQALDRGLRGSIRTMADEVVGKTMETEDEVRSLAKNFNSDVAKNTVENHLTTALRDEVSNFPDKIPEIIAQNKINIGDQLKRQGFEKLANEVSKIPNTEPFESFASKVRGLVSKPELSGGIDISEKQYLGVLKSVAEDYKDVGFGEMAEKANVLAEKIKTNKGFLGGGDALELRRLLDRLRISRSYDVPAGKLSLSQQNLKFLTDELRGRINKIPGMGEAMNNYSFYIDALESLAKEAARRGNSQVISLIDSIFLGGGLSSSNPLPLLTMGVARRALLSGQGMTSLAQMLNKGVISAPASGAIGAASSGAQSQITTQE